MNDDIDCAMVLPKWEECMVSSISREKVRSRRTNILLFVPPEITTEIKGDHLFGRPREKALSHAC